MMNTNSTPIHDALVLLANITVLDDRTNEHRLDLMIEGWLRAGLEVM